MLLRQGLDLTAVEEQSFFGFKPKDRNAFRRAGLDGLRADAGNVEAHIMVFAGNLDGDRATIFSSEYATAGEASVGTLESFDREDDPVFDDDDLADLKARHFFCDAIAESNVFGLFGGKLWPGVKTFPRHQWLEPWRRF